MNTYGGKNYGLGLLKNEEGKVILQNYNLDSVKKVKVRKPWKCEHCNEIINIGENAIKQAVSTTVKGGGGNYFIYLHPKCCIITIRVKDNDGVRFKEIEL